MSIFGIFKKKQKDSKREKVGHFQYHYEKNRRKLHNSRIESIKENVRLELDDEFRTTLTKTDEDIISFIYDTFDLYTGHPTDEEIKLVTEYIPVVEELKNKYKGFNRSLLSFLHFFQSVKERNNMVDDSERGPGYRRPDIFVNISFPLDQKKNNMYRSCIDSMRKHVVRKLDDENRKTLTDTDDSIIDTINYTILGCCRDHEYLEKERIIAYIPIVKELKRKYKSYNSKLYAFLNGFEEIKKEYGLNK